MIRSKGAVLVAPGEVAVDDIEVPEPGPDQVVVRHRSTGVCLSQVHQVETAAAERCPQLLGHEGTGVVTHAGAGVRHVKEGDHVLTTWVPRTPQRGRAFVDGFPPLGTRVRGHPAWGRIGTFCHEMLTHEQFVVPIPAADATPESCIVGCAVLTGAGAVLHTARVRPEDSVVVVGAGGVGLSAIRMAALLGAHPVIAVDVAEDKLAFAREWGATHTINARAEDPLAAIWRITGTGADFAFDAVGTRQAHELILPAVRGGGPGAGNVGGMAVLIGWPQREMTVNAEHFVYHQRQYRGSHGAADPERDFPMYLRLHREGRFPLDRLVTRTYPLAEAATALEDLAGGRIRGRAIITF
jgi:Zn-dependent alcohol dehydrogenase